jgi:hypothetical protein
MINPVPSSTMSSRFSRLSRSRSSSAASFFKYDDLLANFPMPPQGRNVQNQIGLFPAIYTIPYQPPTPPTSTTRPVSPLSPANGLQRTLSTDSEGIYEGLGIQSDRGFAVDSPLQHDTTLSDIDEGVAAFSFLSSTSSLSSTEFHDGAMSEGFLSEDEFSSVSSLPTNPILSQIRQWTPPDVAAFLVDRGYAEQAPNFIRHEISGAILIELNLAMLKEVDIPAFGIRFGIMREIEGLRKLAVPTHSYQASRHRRPRDSGVRLPVRSPSRSVTSGEEEDNEPFPRSQSAAAMNTPRLNMSSPQISASPRKTHHRQSSYEPTTPRSSTAPRPISASSEPRRLSQGNTWGEQLFSSKSRGHRSSQSQDSGLGGSNPNTPDLDDRTPSAMLRGHYKSKSASSGTHPHERSRTDSHDSGIGHSRHASTDTVVNSPGRHSPGKSGHKRNSSSTITVRAQPPSVPLMEAAGAGFRKSSLGKELPAAPAAPTGSVVLQGTRSESPPKKPTAQFLIAPRSTRSPVTEDDRKSKSSNGVRLVKSYGHLRRRSSSNASPIDEADNEGSNSHRSLLLKNISAKEASLGADYSGWLKKRTERGSIAGLGVGPGAGMVGGWKRRWFVLKGRRLSYYHSDKVSLLYGTSNSRTQKRKGLLISQRIDALPRSRRQVPRVLLLI